MRVTFYFEGARRVEALRAFAGALGQGTKIEESRAEGDAGIDVSYRFESPPRAWRIGDRAPRVCGRAVSFPARLGGSIKLAISQASLVFVVPDPTQPPEALEASCLRWVERCLESPSSLVTFLWDRVDPRGFAQVYAASSAFFAEVGMPPLVHNRVDLSTGAGTLEACEAALKRIAARYELSFRSAPGTLD